MLIIRRAAAVAAFTAGLLAVPVAAQATPAETHPVTAAAAEGGVEIFDGFPGTCYPQRFRTVAGGWCDGNGPDWTYRAVVHCSNNSIVRSAARWMGDRRQAWRDCPIPYHAVRGGVEMLYNGNIQRTHLV